MRRFLWFGLRKKNKDRLISWEMCCKSKSSGGLGIGNLRLKNISLWLMDLMFP